MVLQIRPLQWRLRAICEARDPVVLALSTNDALAASAENIGRLLNRRHYYFVPFGQDDPEGKPRSLASELSLLPETMEAALEGRQLQPILISF